jgi:hypothetical protein
VFVGIVFAMAWLLSALFGLIGIDLLSDLLREDWFWRALIGLAFGAALGLLREHDAVVRLLQRVVATVLAVLAPVLAIGLVLFLAALPFTGLQALWDATDAATPILLTCVIGALILANAVIGDVPEHESRFPLMRFGAIALAFVVLPLAALAAIATGLRIGQYGFTPERLWAATFVGIALLSGLGYWWSLLRGRLDWEAVVRPVNLRVAMAVCMIALFLATPILSFNAISTRDQVARLESGRVAPDKFDWAALAFDFGEPGREALERLGGSTNAAIRAKAIEVAKAGQRWDVPEVDRTDERRKELAANLRILPVGTTPASGLIDAVAAGHTCASGAKCSLLVLPGGGEALLLTDYCFDRPPARREAGAEPLVMLAEGCGVSSRLRLVEGKWIKQPEGAVAKDEAAHAAMQAAYKAGQVEVRPVESRQLYVGGVPVGEPFE